MNNSQFILVSSILKNISCRGRCQPFKEMDLSSCSFFGLFGFIVFASLSGSRKHMHGNKYTDVLGE